MATAEAVLCLLSERIDAELLDAAPRLRVVANLAVGFDNIDLAAAAERGVVVTTTPDVLTEATADLAWALLLATARRVVEADTARARGRLARVQPHPAARRTGGGARPSASSASGPSAGRWPAGPGAST